MNKTIKAFTLVEMLIVITVISLLAAFAVPSYQLLFSQLQLNSTVNEVADYIRLAQQKTVTEQVVYGVTVQTGVSTVPLYSYDIATDTKTTVSTLTLPGGIAVTQASFGGEQDIYFSPSGAASTSGSAVLYDSNRGKSRLIEIRPSGNVQTNQPEY